MKQLHPWIRISTISKAPTSPYESAACGMRSDYRARMALADKDISAVRIDRLNTTSYFRRRLEQGPLSA